MRRNPIHGVASQKPRWNSAQANSFDARTDGDLNPTCRVAHHFCIFWGEIAHPFKAVRGESYFNPMLRNSAAFLAGGFLAGSKSPSEITFR